MNHPVTPSAFGRAESRDGDALDSARDRGAADLAPGAPLLRVTHLSTSFPTPYGLARPVDDVSFEVRAGETVCLVGESGSGKSVTALSLLRLIPPPGRIEPSSELVFEGQALLQLDDAGIRAVRGRRIGMIFQEPMAALNPVLTVGEQIAEVVRVHAGATRAEAWARAVEMLTLTGIPAAAERAAQYPHQLSGGMRQRVMIAMALVMRPVLVIADEPTTALDVTIQAQILTLLRDLQSQLGMAVLLITHDLGVVAEMADRVLVMYAGEIVESAPVERLFHATHHPYSEGLLRAMPALGADIERLETIPGTVPKPTEWPAGCRFRERCRYAWERCAREHPPLYQINEGHLSRCHLAEEPERRAEQHPPLAARMDQSA
jgi:oligopeptide/dipeptide ABC transporter ATP-binding protein